MLRSFVVAFVLAAVVAGCGGTAKVAASTPRDQALLSSIVGRMKTDLVSVRIETTSRLLAGGSRHPGQMLVVKSAATTNFGKFRDDWYGGLIGTAYNHQCAARADHCLAWFEGVSQTSRFGRWDVRPPFASRRKLSRLIRAAFASTGLRVTSVSFVRTYALAPVVTVRARDPQAAVDASGKVGAGIPWRHVAGFFFQMLDGHGRVFYAAGGNSVSGGAWVRPDIRLRGTITGATGKQGPTGATGPQGPHGPGTHAPQGP